MVPAFRITWRHASSTDMLLNVKTIYKEFHMIKEVLCKGSFPFCKIDQIWVKAAPMIVSKVAKRWYIFPSAKCIDQKEKDLKCRFCCVHLGPVNNNSTRPHKCKNPCCPIKKWFSLFVRFAWFSAVTYMQSSKMESGSTIWFVAACTNAWFWISEPRSTLSDCVPTSSRFTCIEQYLDGSWCFPPPIGVLGQQLIRLNLPLSNLTAAFGAQHIERQTFWFPSTVAYPSAHPFTVHWWSIHLGLPMKRWWQASWHNFSMLRLPLMGVV